MSSIEEDRNTDRKSGNRSGGSTVAFLVLIAVAAIGVAWMLGLFNIDASGKLEAPRVKVQGGEMPKVQIETADVDVGTKTATIEVPSVEVTPAGDDGSAKR